MNPPTLLVLTTVVRTMSIWAGTEPISHAYIYNKEHYVILTFHPIHASTLHANELDYEARAVFTHKYLIMKIFKIYFIFFILHASL
jgi:hypothetical protein